MFKLNGEMREYKRISVAELLQEEGFRVETVAVEINEEIVSKKSYASVYLKDEDVIEVISFVGGG